jgi:hypothetical protein
MALLHMAAAIIAFRKVGIIYAPFSFHKKGLTWV